MKVFFDYQTFSLQNFGGISRYYAELISGINRTADNEAYLPLLFSNNAHLQENNKQQPKYPISGPSKYHPMFRPYRTIRFVARGKAIRFLARRKNIRFVASSKPYDLCTVDKPHDF